MKTVVIYSPGGYEKLIVEDAKLIEPKDDEVVVQTKASGINYADVSIRWGLYKSAKEFVGWPITPGFEFAGDILKVGSKVTKFKVGDKVLGATLFNGYSGCITTNENFVYKIPSNIDYGQGASFITVFLTAYHALFQHFVTRPGMHMLIHSAAGGVGGALAQLCKISGFKTVGVVGSEHKVDVAKANGVDIVIDKSKQDWVSEAKKHFPNGFDAIFDANGVSTLGDSYKLVKPTGKLVIYGFASMLPKTGGKINWPSLIYNYIKTPRFNPMNLTTDNKSVIAFNLSFLFEHRNLLDEAMNYLLDNLDNGKIKPLNVTSFPVEQIAKAHKLIESGKSTGKIVITH